MKNENEDNVVTLLLVILWAIFVGIVVSKLTGGC